jgi:hypothetical protein
VRRSRELRVISTNRSEKPSDRTYEPLSPEGKRAVVAHLKQQEESGNLHLRPEPPSQPEE